jgi:hypothetical protein
LATRNAFGLTAPLFDCTLSLLILNFVPDRAAAVREMLRVTKPVGVVAAAVWDYGEGMEMLRLFMDETVALRPDLDVQGREVYAAVPARASLRRCARTRPPRHRRRAATIETRFEGFDDYWSPFLDHKSCRRLSPRRCHLSSAMRLPLACGIGCSGPAETIPFICGPRVGGARCRAVAACRGLTGIRRAILWVVTDTARRNWQRERAPLMRHHFTKRHQLAIPG